VGWNGTEVRLREDILLTDGQSITQSLGSETLGEASGKMKILFILFLHFYVVESLENIYLPLLLVDFEVSIVVKKYKKVFSTFAAEVQTKIDALVRTLSLRYRRI
jgi:hypothetical protein